MSLVKSLKTGAVPEKKSKKLPLSEYDRFAISTRRVLKKNEPEFLSAPLSSSDAERAIELFRSGKSLIISLSGLGKIDHARFLDVMSGAVGALGGAVVSLKEDLYLFLVRNADIICLTD